MDTPDWLNVSRSQSTPQSMEESPDLRGKFSVKIDQNICDMRVFSEEENPWNGGQFKNNFQTWKYIIVGSGLSRVAMKFPQVAMK